MRSLFLGKKAIAGKKMKRLTVAMFRFFAVKIHAAVIQMLFVEI